MKKTAKKAIRKTEQKSVARTALKRTVKKSPPRDGLKPAIGGDCLLIKNGPGPFFIKPKASTNSRVEPDIEYTFSLQLGSDAPDSSVSVQLRAYFATVNVKSSGEFELVITSSGTIGNDYLDQTTGYFDGIENVTVTTSSVTSRDFVLLGDSVTNEGLQDTLLLILGRGTTANKTYECALVYNIDTNDSARKAKKKKPSVKSRKKA